MPVVFALVASVIWGSADFVGGTTSRELAATTVMLWSTLLALPVLVTVALLSGDLRLDATTIGWGVMAGVCGSLGLVSLYQGLATGVMGVVAPISSASVIVPVIVGVMAGDALGAVRVVAIVVAIVGIVLTGGPHLRDFRTGGHRPVLFAMGAAVLIGLALVGLAYGSESSSVSTLLVQRLVYVVVLATLVLATGAPRRPAARHLVPLGLIGCGDILANGLFAVATRSGPLAVVSVLASVYPVMTVLLARRFHHETMRQVQAVGVLVAFVGVAGVVAS